MTITELLAKRSLLKKKISNMLKFGYGEDNIQFIHIIYDATGVNNNNIPKEQLEKDIKSSFDRINDSMRNFRKYTSIKNEFNAKAKITIAGKEYTVAEALALNNEDVKEFYKTLINKMRNDLALVRKAYNDYQTKQFSDENINKFIAVTLGENAAKEDNSSEKVKELIETFKSGRSISYVDPLNLEEEIKSMSDWFDEFYTTVNFKLSELNSSVKIEVDLDKETDLWSFVEN